MKESDDFYQSATEALLRGENEYFISAITLGEALVGYMKTEQSKVIVDQLLSALTILDVDSEIAIEAASLRALKGVKLPDALIAATAKINGLALWTFDLKQSKSVAGSRLLTK